MRYVLSIGVPLVLGAATGSLRDGVVAGIGGLYVVNIANVDAKTPDRLLATLVGAFLITGCAQIGGWVANSQLAIAVGLLVLATTAGWLHQVHLAIEIVARFAVLGYLFGALQLSAFGSQLIPIDERVLLIFLSGGLWTTAFLTIEQRLFRASYASIEPALSEGWRRIRSLQTAGVRFALCYGIVITLAFVGSSLMHLPRPFWVTATVAIVMKPDSRATVRRTVERIVGTLIGVMLVEAIISATANPSLLIICILLAAAIVPIGLIRNYTLCCVAITVLVLIISDLLMLDRGGDRDLLAIRFYATLIGCTLTAIGTAITYPDLWLPKHARD